MCVPNHKCEQHIRRAESMCTTSNSRPRVCDPLSRAAQLLDDKMGDLREQTDTRRYCWPPRWTHTHTSPHTSRPSSGGHKKLPKYSLSHSLSRSLSFPFQLMDSLCLFLLGRALQALRSIVFSNRYTGYMESLNVDWTVVCGQFCLCHAWRCPLTFPCCIDCRLQSFCLGMKHTFG